jgi:superfamily II DNA helicase RecQ
MITSQILHETLKENFGLRNSESIKEVLMPFHLARTLWQLCLTGGGKSICFQLPALLLSGITIILH